MPSPHLLAASRTKDPALLIVDGNATTVVQTKVLVWAKMGRVGSNASNEAPWTLAATACLH